MSKRNQGQRNGQLSDEELQRTQVLNLKDFKETARIEKLSSKKPALIVAIVGLLLISIGISMPAVQSMSARKAAEEAKNEIEKRRQDEVKVVEEELTCHWERLNNENGTDEKLDATFTFKDDKLQTSKKVYRLTKSAMATTEPAELTNYLTALQSYLMQISGYKLSVQTIANGSITTTDVDYTLLNIAQVPQQHQTNYRFNVLHQVNTSKEDVSTSMTALGYTCE